MVENLKFIPIGRNQWRLTWSSDQTDPVYRIYRDGNLISTTSNGSWTLLVGDDEMPVIEILDDSEGDPQRVFPGRVTLAWFAEPDVASYDVQEFVSGVWTSRQIIRADGATSYFRWTSRVISDGEDVDFRVVPTGANANLGTAAELSVLMVKTPDPPQASFSYSSSTHKVTIS